MRSRSGSLVLMVAAALLLVPAAPAAAHISQFEIALIVGHGVPGGIDFDHVDGSITCTAGEGYLITAKVTDSPSYVGKGRTIGTCTGEEQTWVVSLTDESGVGDAVCPFLANARAHNKVGSEPHGSASASFDPC